MSLIQGRPSFLAVPVHLRTFEGCPAEMATYGENRVFAFARRTDHDCGLARRQLFRRLSCTIKPVSKQYLWEQRRYEHQRCDSPSDYNVNPQVESGLVIARVRSRVAMGGHDIPKAKVRERYDLTCWSLLPLYDGQLAIRNPCARLSG